MAAAETVVEGVAAAETVAGRWGWRRWRAALRSARAGLGVYLGRCYPGGVNALKAHVRNGQIVLDEPGELPEGAEVDVLVRGADPHDQMDQQERAALLQSIDEGLADVDAGDVIDFGEYLASLRVRQA